MVTVTGIVLVASLDSAIEVTPGVSIGFLTDSPDAEIIFSSCKNGETCKVTGTVSGTGMNAFFRHVAKAVVVRRGRLVE